MADPPGPPALAVLTSGGDAPGMNAALWAFCARARARGRRTLGVRRGFAGLLERDAAPFEPDALLPSARRGGTLLGTSRLADLPERAAELRAALADIGATALAVLGGNGSLAACAHLAGDAEGVPVVGLPATIDNDVAESDESIGFATALDTGLLLLDGIRDTAEAMPRLFALETLGGATPFLAAAVAAAGAADLLLVPETDPSDGEIAERIGAVLERRPYAVIVASEGYDARARGGLEATLERLSDAVGVRYRLTRAGHAQRGGRPAGRDRTLAVALGEAAADALAAGRSGRLLWRGGPELLPFGGAPVKTWTPPTAPAGSAP